MDRRALDLFVFEKKNKHIIYKVVFNVIDFNNGMWLVVSAFFVFVKHVENNLFSSIFFESFEMMFRFNFEAKRKDFILSSQCYTIHLIVTNIQYIVSSCLSHF